MPDIQQIIQSGAAHAWLYLPIAILLGALHGLEPGHSKTMMAAFIIAIRGTIWQAVLLGTLCRDLSLVSDFSARHWGPAVWKPVERRKH